MKNNYFWYKINYIDFVGVEKAENGYLSFNEISKKVKEYSSFGNELIKFTMKRGQ